MYTMNHVSTNKKKDLGILLHLFLSMKPITVFCYAWSAPLIKRVELCNSNVKIIPLVKTLFYKFLQQGRIYEILRDLEIVVKGREPRLSGHCASSIFKITSSFTIASFSPSVR